MRFYPNGGVGGGISSSDVTVTKYDIPKSKTALTSDSNDEVVSGMMNEYNSENEATSSLNDENSRLDVAIPNRGLYETTAKLYIPYNKLAALIGLTADKVANNQKILDITGTYKGRGNAVATDVLPGKTFSTALLDNVSGAMPVQGGSNNVPTTAQKLIVPAGRYVNQNVYIAGDPNFIEANIKKNVTIWGKRGTAEGYFPTATDLYLRGNNIHMDATYGSSYYQTGQIKGVNSFILKTKSFNFTPYSKINIEMNLEGINYGSGYRITLGYTYNDERTFVDAPSNHQGPLTLSLNISNLKDTAAWFLNWHLRGGNTYIYRIWVS